MGTHKPAAARTKRHTSKRRWLAGDLLTTAQVMEILGVSEDTLRRYRADGRLAHFRVGSNRGPIRIPFFAVEELLVQGAVEEAEAIADRAAEARGEAA